MAVLNHPLIFDPLSATLVLCSVPTTWRQLSDYTHYCFAESFAKDCFFCLLVFLMNFVCHNSQQRYCHYSWQQLWQGSFITCATKRHIGSHGPCSEVQQMRKWKTHLLGTHSWKVLPVKPGGQPMASPAAKVSFLELISTAWSIHLHFFQTSPKVFPLLIVVLACSCVGLQNKIGHPACHSTWLIQIWFWVPTEYK